MVDFMKRLWESWVSAVVFYTILPLPVSVLSTFDRSFGSRMARCIVWVGLLLGSLITFWDKGLELLGFSQGLRSGLDVALGVFLTGGLHLDGAMDTADGLGVMDEKRRLEVMRDSHSGAFAVMSAVIILGLKVIALSEINEYRGLSLILAMGWSRWGQVCSIAFYPYLREEGKGSIHKTTIKPLPDISLGLMTLILENVAVALWLREGLDFMIKGSVIGLIVSLGIGYYFNVRFHGHTGDTYGAVVEWSEVIILCCLSAL